MVVAIAAKPVLARVLGVFGILVRQTFNPLVPGSSPGRPTICINDLAQLTRLGFVVFGALVPLRCHFLVLLERFLLYLLRLFVNPTCRSQTDAAGCVLEYTTGFARDALNGRVIAFDLGDLMVGYRGYTPHAGTGTHTHPGALPHVACRN